MGIAADTIDTALASILRPGQEIVIGQALGTPTQLLTALPRHLDRLQGSRILVGWVLSDFPALPGVNIDSFFPSGPFGSEAGLAQRNARYLRTTLYELASAFDRGTRPVDVVLAQAAPLREGAYSLGVTLDFVHPAAMRAQHVVLEINPHTPRTGPYSTIAAAPHVIALEAGEGPAEASGAMRAGQEALAANLLPWIPDQATLEFGIGQWFPPLVSQLAVSRRRLRVHTGQVGKWVRQFIDAGALDDEAPIVGTGAAGDADFYQYIDGNPRIELRPATLTHDPATLSRLPLFRAMNSVFEVDLLGQANSELAPNGALGGIAGLPDFARGARANPEGLSIVVLASTARGQSRIVPRVACPIPSLASGEIDVIVTEQGSADLRGLAPADRAAAIIAVADEAHRPALAQAARALP